MVAQYTVLSLKSYWTMESIKVVLLISRLNNLYKIEKPLKFRSVAFLGE
jgi:hypothetical protein